jgi:hypothetical protein
MSLSEILPNSFLVSLAISLAVVSIAGYFFLQRINEQNHKISSMLGLVTTMAEDLNGMRSYIHASGMTGGVGAPNPIAMQSAENSQDQDSLIDVSDEDSGDSGEDSGEDSDDESEEDSDDEVDDVNIASQVNIIDLNLSGNVKVINMDNNVDDNVDDNIIPVKINGVFSADELNSSCDDDDDDDDDEDNASSENDHDLVVSMASLKDITLNPIQKTDLLMSIEPIVDLEQSNNEIDVIEYKKLAIGKLRGIVEEKGIVTDASKMKKVEILKALGHE